MINLKKVGIMVSGSILGFLTLIDPAASQNFQALKAKAETGDAAAQYELGYMFEKSQDYNKAKTLFEQAAAQGYAKAQWKLGVMYLGHQGLEEDLSQAAAWLEKAAAQGYAKAQYKLGYMFDYGKGVTQDYARAKAWLKMLPFRGTKGP